MTRRDLLRGLAAAPLSVGPLSRLASANAPADDFDRLLAAARRGKWRDLPLGERVGRVGKHFLGTPYVGGTLENPGGSERCVVRLDGLDCVTLFETSLAFARLLGRPGTPTRDALTNMVRETRYRDGSEAGYLSRLHYTTDWFARNAERGIVRILRLPGSVPLEKTIDFMTRHAASYKMLAPSDHAELATHERRISALRVPYVPRADWREIETHLQTGDIVGLVTTREGMDIDHTGLIIRDGQRARFLHASSVAEKVVLDAPISEMQTTSRIIGAAFARPIRS